MNLFNKAFLSVLVVLSGTVLAGCKSCRVKRTAPATALVRKKAIRAGKAHKTKHRRVTNVTKRIALKAHAIRQVNRVALRDHIAMKAAIHASKKGSCANGRCSR